MGLLINRRTVITFEKLERSFYHLPNSEPLLKQCDECQKEVSWLTPTQAVTITGLTLREIFRRIESHTLHFDETPQGLLHICPRSVALALETRGGAAA